MAHGKSLMNRAFDMAHPRGSRRWGARPVVARDRSLRGKARIRARKAAQRAERAS